MSDDIFCPLSAAETWAPRRWDPFSVQGGSFCCSGIWKIGSSVRKTTIFRTSKWGPAWPAYPGVEAQGQWPHSPQRGCQQKNSVSRLADWPDCSGTHDVTKIAADELLKQPKVQAQLRRPQAISSMLRQQLRRLRSPPKRRRAMSRQFPFLRSSP